MQGDDWRDCVFHGAGWQVFVVFALLAKPFDRWLPDACTSEGMKSFSGTTYLIDSSKARRELGFNPTQIREA